MRASAVPYQITGKTLQLSASYDRHRAVGAIVAPELSAFRTAVGWPSGVAILDHDAMLVVETSRETGPMFLNRRPGYRAPVLATSPGLAYLAHCADGERATLLARAAGDPAPWNDLARDPPLAERTLAAIRDRGFATMSPHYEDREYAGRISSLGVPIMRNGRIYAAINILYLLSALSPDQAEAALLGPLQDTARGLGEELARRSVD